MKSHAASRISSMTGFARADGGTDGHAWTIEIRSVNGRNLDIRCRLPAGFDALDATARTEIPRQLRRGNVNLTLNITRTAPVQQVRVNRDLLEQLLAVARDLEDAGVAAPRLDGLLAIRGVIETTEEAESVEQRSQLEAALTDSLREALDQLAAVRLAEGDRLLDVLTAHLSEIEALTRRADGCTSLQPATIREKLRNQVAALLDTIPALSEDRLAQEVALLLTKSDVREELDRLIAHVAAARQLLQDGGAVGRRLDFLCQEFNREANTLCSKSSDIELTSIGLALKAAIEQMREQVQNIE